MTSFYGDEKPISIFAIFDEKRRMIDLIAHTSKSPLGRISAPTSDQFRDAALIALKKAGQEGRPLDVEIFGFVANDDQLTPAA